METQGNTKAKPPSVLVYTAGDAEAYDRIRSVIKSLISPSVYTVFNISPTAIRKEHWIDPNTACIIIADTNELDNLAWKLLQEYFLKSGKIIFLRQNGFTSIAESVKKQVSLLSCFFGADARESMEKNLEEFLQKSLESAENEEVNERYQLEDAIDGNKYSVALSKKKDCPLLLFLESDGSHTATVVSSDATTDQLLAPGSRIVAEALERVGIKLEEGVKMPSLSIEYFVSDEKFLNECKKLRYGEEIGNNPKMIMQRNVVDIGHLTPTETMRPVLALTREEALTMCPFDTKRYYATLATKGSLGRNGLFIPVTMTTMDDCKSLSEAIGYDGLCVVAREQLKGQGRQGCEFISREGTAMFTFSGSLPSPSVLSRCPSIVQYIACVAVASAVHELSGVEDFPLRIKWPNDLYFNRAQKIGGLLMIARTVDDDVEFTMGIGINVSNSLPTTCLNAMMPDKEGTFCIEEVIAMTLNKFEYFTEFYEREGHAAFLEHYRKYWLHNDEEVTLGDENEKVVMIGLDKYGFLECRSKSTGKIYTVSDDGNTFDMMKGLIRLKM